MHGSNKWTIEKWHLMLALRHFNYLLPEDALEFPRDGQIEGPNEDWEGKEFFAYVTVRFALVFFSLPMRELSP
jgi:hypothetical protein